MLDKKQQKKPLSQTVYVLNMKYKQKTSTFTFIKNISAYPLGQQLCTLSTTACVSQPHTGAGWHEFTTRMES